MRKNKQYLFKSSLLLLIVLFSSCIVDTGPESNANVQFGYYGIQNGSFQLFKQHRDSSSYFIMYGGGHTDSITRIYAIRWGIGHETADIAIIYLQGFLGAGQNFNSDSSKFIATAAIGFNTHVIVTHELNEDLYSLPDSTSFKSAKFTFSVSHYEDTSNGAFIDGNFSGFFLNSKGEVLNVQNGNLSLKPVKL